MQKTAKRVLCVLLASLGTSTLAPAPTVREVAKKVADTIEDNFVLNNGLPIALLATLMRLKEKGAEKAQDTAIKSTIALGLLALVEKCIPERILVSLRSRLSAPTFCFLLGEICMGTMFCMSAGERVLEKRDKILIKKKKQTRVDMLRAALHRLSSIIAKTPRDRQSLYDRKVLAIGLFLFLNTQFGITEGVLRALGHPQ